MINHTRRSGRPRDNLYFVRQTWWDGYGQMVCTRGKKQLRQQLSFLRNASKPAPDGSSTILGWTHPRDSGGRWVKA